MIELPRNIDLDNPEFQQAYRLLKETTANVFLTGKAGTGKSTFLRYICKKLNNNMVVLAPTGVAAVNIGGQTIHSFFQMPLRPVPPDDPEYSVAQFKNSSKLSKQKKKLIRELDLIIIDEVSMVRPDMIDFIDRALRGIRDRRGEPFGGVQLLLVGDIFQLEPVVTHDTRNILSRYYSDYFFFNARAYSEVNLVSIELKKIYRQTDSAFINMLDRIRLNQATHEDFRQLNSQRGNGNDVRSDDFGIVLASRRDAASAINAEKMEQLDAEERVLVGTVEGEFPEKIRPTDLELTMKVGAQVMLIRNDKDRRWVNGTLAKITEIGDKDVTIELENGNTETVEQETWENITYAYDEEQRKVVENVIGKFTQFPLKAAWALTIHKSQGLTFNNVTIDMGGGAFSAGQTYVALSRCRSMEGLKFINPLKPYDVIVSKGAAEFSKQFNDTRLAEKALRDAHAKSLAKMAKVRFKAGDYQHAVEDAWEVNTLTGDLARPEVRRLISRYLSSFRVMKKELEEREKVLKELAEEYVEMGKMLLNESADAATAKKNFEKALKLDPDNEEALLRLAESNAELGKVKEACKQLEKIKRKGGEYKYKACLLKGDILAEAGSMSEAALNYMEAGKLSPKEREPFERLVELFDRHGMDEEADMYRDFLDEID